MHALEEIERQFQFMVVEVAQQLEDAALALESDDVGAMARVDARDDRVDNLKSMIENACFSRLLGQSLLEQKELDFTRAVNIIANNLERISDYSVRIVQRTTFVGSRVHLGRYEHRPLFNEVREALDVVVQALFEQDLSLASKICNSESVLDGLYKAIYADIVERLKSSPQTSDLVTTLFIFRYLERMGDALLNIGEAIIFSVLGEKLKIDQYRALQRSLDDLGLELPLHEIAFEGIWGTRSGCRIGKLSGKSRRGATVAIFKEGKHAKILQERRNLEIWKRIRPKLTPRVLGFHEDTENASLSLEFLEGLTIQEVLARGDTNICERALEKLIETMVSIWTCTMKKEATRTTYIEQLFSRLDDVLAVHPDLKGSNDEGGMLEPIELLRELESGLLAPFTVFAHGDFNTNNILYDARSDEIRYIDVHRSRDEDYVQDVSVFLVSNLRVPSSSRRVRRRLNEANSRFLGAVRGFAREHQDGCFDARLSLGLIRSFVTSARFELDTDFAEEMISRALEITSRLLRHPPATLQELYLDEDMVTRSES